MEFKLGPIGAAARTAAAIGVAGGLLSACGGDDFMATNNLPTGVTQQSITVYPATTPASGTTAATQDLLTAGLGKIGLASAVVPAYADPLNPTALELRRNAFHSNYRGLVDPSAGGGFGTLYGPNVDVNGVAAGEGMIPGREYIGTIDDGSGKKRVTIAVQIPDSFNQAAPCLVLGPSSGSRGVYGALATASDWGLKHGCAVALTDAGKGIGLYDIWTTPSTALTGRAPAAPPPAR
jgi:hydroxybutyrate-dimer hydrolase